MKTAIVVVVLIGIAAVMTWFLLRGRAGARVKDSVGPEDAGRGLRLMALTTPAEKYGLRSDGEYPQVYGVIVDWNLGEQTASILAMRDGSASLYTTSSFGIIGGQAHATVRRAAEACAKLANQYYAKGTPATDFTYPKAGKVYFYLLCYEGVRLCVAEETALETGSDPMVALFSAAQDVLTELRLVTEEEGT